MKTIKFFLLLLAVNTVFTASSIGQQDPISYIKPFMGSGGRGQILPVVLAPFGMVQLGPDTRTNSSGYNYYDNSILGFSHIHKSGGGCNDFLDILFMPVSNEVFQNTQTFPLNVSVPNTHKDEFVEPAYYSLKLPETNINVELTATERCGVHRYKYPQGKPQQLVIDLHHGSTGSCTTIKKENFDTVKIALLEVVNNHSISGYRISNGWAPEQHVYFYAEFSKPFTTSQLYDKQQLISGAKKVSSADVRAILEFDSEDVSALVARVGISSVSIEGARKNLQSEVNTWNFDDIRQQTRAKWSKNLSAIKVKDTDTTKLQLFYSSLYFAQFYPMLYSDVTGEYRGPDRKVHKCDFPYYGAVLGLWDTYRAHNPLISILHPEVTNDLINTFLEHYKHFGQLPMWVLAGQENFCMIGYHSMPVIADAYYKGIRNYDVKAIYDAMKTSACKDTFGYWMHDFRGAKYYKQLKYVPYDKEIASAAKTLEYCYDDWCIAQMAKMLGEKKDYKYYIERAGYYKNLFDKRVGFFRGKSSTGEWRVPFDPFYDNHLSSTDDFCEGTPWQWLMFVPHDGKGLINLMGGKETFITKFDSLFTVSSVVHGNKPTPASKDGLIGQFAFGNEPGHHYPYMYNYVGQPWKTQKWASQVLYTLYNTSPRGICGNEDTGQMAAWYVLSSMGFYPVTHGTGVYFIGTPIMSEVLLNHAKGTLTIKANNVSRENVYIQSLKLNGKPYNKSWISHQDLFGSNALLEFEMAGTPNTKWASDANSIPPSMADEKF